ncbi:MAG: flagellar protein FlgN, partial [Phycisphaerae bacterium]|nr:flagellar protein FlgN [Phycisphaerae bacterium]MDW8263281.1 flagellar export chaperone FlgN [Phycisphaerales bacterium]
MTEAQIIIEAIESQRGCYRQLSRLIEAQHEHVLNGDAESLLQVLGQRQQLIGQLGQLERTVS